ncbi:MAG: hypothetical protein K9H58_08740 [Bacteroidales bacterium]|nr:hypothetical protein [Bacteroidales bacterium]
MLRYCKTVLQKVSFSRELFQRELNKSIQWLRKEEINALKIWCIINFGAIYMDVINEVFKQV